MSPGWLSAATQSRRQRSTENRRGDVETDTAWWVACRFRLPPLSGYFAFAKLLPFCLSVVLGGSCASVASLGLVSPPGAAPPTFGAGQLTRHLGRAESSKSQSRRRALPGGSGIGPTSAGSACSPSRGITSTPKVRPLEDSRGVTVGRGRPGRLSELPTVSLGVPPGRAARSASGKDEAGDAAPQTTGQNNQEDKARATGRNTQRAAIATARAAPPPPRPGGSSIDPADRRLPHAPAAVAGRPGRSA